MAGNKPSGSAPERVNSSVWQMPVALISTITSPALGPSSLTVVTSSGLPAWTATAARTSIAALPFEAPAEAGGFAKSAGSQPSRKMHIMARGKQNLCSRNSRRNPEGDWDETRQFDFLTAQGNGAGRNP